MKKRIINLLIFLVTISANISAQNEAKFIERAKDADFVVVAEVIEREDSVGFWSGLFPSIQQVRYRVVKALKGKIDSKDVFVGHYVVKNSYNANTEVPQLSPILFKPGNKLILLISSKGAPNCRKETNDSNLQTFCSSSENFGVRHSNQSLEEKIEQSIRN